jgi:hypothetical protein
MIAWTQRIALASFWLVTILTCQSGSANAQDRQGRNRKVVYTLVQEAGPEPVWRVHIVGQGFSKLPRLRMKTWGGWSEWEGYYIRNVIARPAARNIALPGGILEFVSQGEWNGTFEVSYQIPLLRVGSKVQQHAGLLPSFEGLNSCGFAWNTLMELIPGTDGAEVEIFDRFVRIVPPSGSSVATGWGGVTKQLQEIHLAGPLDNTPILIGVPASIKRSEGEGVRYEVAQFGKGWDRTDAVLKVAQSVVPSYEWDSGHKLKHPVRIFLFDGASANTHTPSASLIGYRETEKEFSNWSKQTLAHELFHDWLGVSGDWIEGDESIAWFHEGFTDYLSLWYTAATDVVNQEWFANRLSALNESAHRSLAYGKVAFAEPGVRWRAEGYENLAYKGGAILAFLTDVELRKHGRRGLMELVADLGKQQRSGPVTLNEIAKWMKDHDLADFYQRYYQGKGLPEIDDALKTAGYVVQEGEAELTYFGVRNEGDRVVELDPNGPAALAGMKVGDQIGGYFPTRDDRPRYTEQIGTRFTFGLNTIQPGRTGTYIDIIRDGRQFQLPVQPQIIRGGQTIRYVADKNKLESFFSYRR